MQIELKQQQVDFIGSCEQFPAYIAAVGTGKSTSLIAKALFHSKESPGNLGVIVRRQFTDLRNSTIKDFESYTGLKVNESTHECKLPNGSCILFIHGDVLDTLKNINCGWFAIEQAEEFPDDTAFQFLKMRLRRKVEFRTGFVIGNANGHNWIWRIWKQNGCPPNHELIEATTLDFADIHAPDYIENLKTLPDKLYRRYVLNSWEEAEGLVLDEFNEAAHVSTPHDIPLDWKHSFALDHGFRSPTAVLFYAIDQDANIIIYDEHYEREKPVSHHADAIKRKFTAPYNGIADPSIFSKTSSVGMDMRSIADEYKECGIALHPAIRADKVARIARCNEFFKKGQIRIFSNCVNLRQEIANWKWKQPKPGAVNSLKDEPDDRDDHAIDALLYIVASRDKAEQVILPESQNTPAYFKKKLLAEQEAKRNQRFNGNVFRRPFNG